MNKVHKKTDRRDFLNQVIWILLSIGGALFAFIGLIIPFPRIGRKQNIKKISRPEEYPMNRFTFVETARLFVYRDREGVRAISASCTHLGCVLNHSGDGFVCPCHGSVYNKEGQVLSGPAPADLNWFQITTAPDGRMVVHLDRKSDPNKRFLRRKLPTLPVS